MAFAGVAATTSKRSKEGGGGGDVGDGGYSDAPPCSTSSSVYQYHNGATTRPAFTASVSRGLSGLLDLDIDALQGAVENEYKQTAAQDKPPASTLDVKLYRPTLYTCWAVCLVVFMDISMVNPTMQPYVSLNCGDTHYYGWVANSFFAAQVISSLLFAVWAVKRTPKEAILVSVSILALGNLVYAMAVVPDVASHGTNECSTGSVCLEPTVLNVCSKDTVGKHLIWAGRALAGMGAGAVTVVFGVMARITLPSEKIWAFATARSISVFAFVLAPLIATLFSLIKCSCMDGVLAHGSPLVNEYTLPGYLVAFMAAVVILMVCLIMRNPPPPHIEPEQQQQQQQQQQQAVTPRASLFRLHRGHYTLVFVASAVSLCAVAFATVFVPATSNSYGWSTTANALVFLGFGLVDVASAILSTVLASRIGGRVTLVIGMLVFAFGCSTELMPQPLYAHKWYNAGWFFASTLCVGIGYGISASLCPGLFAEMIPDDKRQKLMSIIPTFTAIGRAIGPVLAVYTFTPEASCQGGHWKLMCADRATQASLCGLCLVSTAAIVACWKYIGGDAHEKVQNRRHAKLQGVAEAADPEAALHERLLAAVEDSVEADS